LPNGNPIPQAKPAPDNNQTKCCCCPCAPFWMVMGFLAFVSAIIYFNFYGLPELKFGYFAEKSVSKTAVYSDLVASFGGSPFKNAYYKYGEKDGSVVVFTKVLSLRGRDLHVNLNGKIEVEWSDKIEPGKVLIGVRRAECFTPCVSNNVRIIVANDEELYEWHQSIIEARNKARRLSKADAPSAPQRISPPKP